MLMLNSQPVSQGGIPPQDRDRTMLMLNNRLCRDKNALAQIETVQC